MRRLAILVLFVLALHMKDTAHAQPRGFLYDESKVQDYQLPDPLKFENGEPVKTKADWAKRRVEIFDLFQSQVYGKAPDDHVHVMPRDGTSKEVLDGQAILEQIPLQLSKRGPTVDVLIIRPANKKNVPAFLGLNFMGNHTVFADPDIWITKSWVRNDKRLGATDHKASSVGRGKQASRWSTKMIVEAGYALVTVYYGDIDPDFDDGFNNGIHGAFRQDASEKIKPDDWGSIAGWAYGLSRVREYLLLHPAIDGKKVFVMGHSRLGKTALWAGATDPNFAGVISNNSGCGGAALSKRRFGETVARINTSFPHWFCDNFLQYNDKEAELPVDQHQLIALCAPTPVYVASASKDLWADPKGEFLAVKAASPVYELLTGKGFEIQTFPPTNQPSIGVLSYHCREGGHNVTDFDWANYIKFANLALK